MILLPRGRLSWSAWSLWKSSKKGFRNRYYENGPNIDSPELRYGSMISRMLEEDPENELIRDVPRYGIPEHTIDVVINGVRILGELDTFDINRKRFDEYKTGVEPWDKVRVKKHKQLPWYAMLVRAEYGEYDPEVKLHWIPTELIKSEKDDKGIEWEISSKKLRRTGEVRSFTRHIEEWEVDVMEREMLAAAYAINLDYRQYLATLDI